MEKLDVTLRLSMEQLGLLARVLRVDIEQFVKLHAEISGTEFYQTTLANLKEISAEVRYEFQARGGKEWYRSHD